MLLTSVLVSLLAWLIRSTPIFIVEEHLNNKCFLSSYLVLGLLTHTLFTSIIILHYVQCI